MPTTNLDRVVSILESVLDASSTTFLVNTEDQGPALVLFSSHFISLVDFMDTYGFKSHLQHNDSQIHICSSSLSPEDQLFIFNCLLGISAQISHSIQYYSNLIHSLLSPNLLYPVYFWFPACPRWFGVLTVSSPSITFKVLQIHFLLCELLLQAFSPSSETVFSYTICRFVLPSVLTLLSWTKQRCFNLRHAAY